MRLEREVHPSCGHALPCFAFGRREEQAGQLHTAQHPPLPLCSVVGPDRSVEERQAIATHIFQCGSELPGLF